MRAARIEARDSLETTINAIEAKDDKALATVRINLVLVGVPVTVVSSFPSALRFVNWLTLLGFASLVASTGLGILTYSGTDYPPGVSPAYVRDVKQAPYSESEWFRWMTAQYEQWLRETLETDEVEAMFLQWTHVLQAAGMLLLVIGFVAGVVGTVPSSSGNAFRTGFALFF